VTLGENGYFKRDKYGADQYERQNEHRGRTAALRVSHLRNVLATYKRRDSIDPQGVEIHRAHPGRHVGLSPAFPGEPCEGKKYEYRHVHPGGDLEKRSRGSLSAIYRDDRRKKDREHDGDDE